MNQKEPDQSNSSSRSEPLTEFHFHPYFMLMKRLQIRSKICQANSYQKSIDMVLQGHATGQGVQQVYACTFTKSIPFLSRILNCIPCSYTTSHPKRGGRKVSTVAVFSQSRGISFISLPSKPKKPSQKKWSRGPYRFNSLNPKENKSFSQSESRYFGSLICPSGKRYIGHHHATYSAGMKIKASDK